MRLSGQAIRSVARGVVVTAVVQALIGGIGLWIAGVPFAALLTALMFLLAMAQIGAVPVLVLAVIWLYWSGAPGWGTFLLVVTVVAGTLDNYPAPVPHQAGRRRPAAAAHLHRRDRRPDRLRPDRHLHRARWCWR